MNMQRETWTSPSQTKNPTTIKTFQVIKELAAGYLALSVLTLASIVARRHDTHAVNSAVWTRGVIVTASAVLTLVFTIRAARGSRRAYVRLRIVSILMPLAIVGHHRPARHLSTLDEDRTGRVRRDARCDRSPRQQPAHTVHVP